MKKRRIGKGAYLSVITGAAMAVLVFAIAAVMSVLSFAPPLAHAATASASYSDSTNNPSGGSMYISGCNSVSGSTCTVTAGSAVTISWAYSGPGQVLNVNTSWGLIYAGGTGSVTKIFNTVGTQSIWTQGNPDPTSYICSQGVYSCNSAFIGMTVNVTAISLPTSPATTNNMHVSYGRIDSSGTIGSGSSGDFTVAKAYDVAVDGTEPVYKITFNAGDFSYNPVVLVNTNYIGTCNGYANISFVARTNYTSYDSTSNRYTTEVVTGARECYGYYPFSFIAVGAGTPNTGSVGTAFGLIGSGGAADTTIANSGNWSSYGGSGGYSVTFSNGVFSAAPTVIVDPFPSTNCGTIASQASITSATFTFTNQGSGNCKASVAQPTYFFAVGPTSNASLYGIQNWHLAGVEFGGSNNILASTGGITTAYYAGNPSGHSSCTNCNYGTAYFPSGWFVQPPAVLTSPHPGPFTASDDNWDRVVFCSSPASVTTGSSLIYFTGDGNQNAGSADLCTYSEHTPSIGTDLIAIGPGTLVPPGVVITCNGATGSCSIPYNNTANIAWSSTNATSCSGSGTNGSSATSGGPWTTPALTSNVAYTVTCTGPGGSATGNVSVSVGAAPVDNAQFVSWTPPPLNMTPGQTATVSVTMKNTGNTTWVNGTAPNLYRLGSQNPQDNVNWGNGRVALNAGETIAPGASKTFTWTVTAPSTPGTYNFQWQMVHELVAWFGDMTPNEAVTVAASVGTITVQSVNAVSGAAVNSQWYFFPGITSSGGGTICYSVTNPCPSTPGSSATYNSQPLNTYTIYAIAGSAGPYYVFAGVRTQYAAKEVMWDRIVSFVRGLISPRAYAMTYNLRTQTLTSAATASFIIYWSPINPVTNVTCNGSSGSCTIPYNTTAQIAWSSSNAVSCSGTGTNSTNTSGSWTTPALTASQTYNVTCTNPVGTNTASITVNVAPPLAVTASITCNGSNPCTVPYNTAANIVWSSTNATSCSGTGTNGSANPSGSWTTPALTSNTSYSVTCTGAGGSQTATVSVTVPPPAAVTASITCNSVNPCTVPYNTAAKIAWTSTNATSCSGNGTNGSAATNGSWTTPALTTSASYSVSCTGAGGTQTASVNVTVSPPPTVSATTTCNGTAGSCTIPYNATATIAWVSSNATSCSGTGTNGSTGTSGSWTTPALTASVSYSVTCTGAAGSAPSTVNVIVSPATAPTASITCNGVSGSCTVAYDGQPTIHWSSTNAGSCSGNGTNGSTATNGTWTTPPLSGSGTYSVTCTGPGGSASANVNVNVQPPPSPTASITCNGSTGSCSVAYNGTAQIAWTSTNSTSCSGSGTNGSTNTSGSWTTGPLTGSGTYDVTCTGAGGSITSSVSVNVAAPPPATVSVTCNGSSGSCSIPYNGTTSIAWTSTNATSCSGTGTNGSTNTSGSWTTPNLKAATTYTVNCTGSGSPGTGSVTVNVAAPPTVKVTVNTPPPIAPGEAVQVSCTTNGTAGSYNWSSPGGAPALQSGGSTYTVAYTSGGTYTVTCTDTTYDVSGSASVTVVSPSCTFTPSPTSVIPPQQTTLTWSCSYATNCNINGTTVSSSSGCAYASPTGGNSTYVLTCSGSGSGSGNTVSYTVDVNVQGTNLRETNP